MALLNRKNCKGGQPRQLYRDYMEADDLEKELQWKTNDIAAPKVQAVHAAHLREVALKPMYSRCGKETANYHHEFMKATAHQRYVTIDEKERAWPKVESGVQTSKFTKKGISIGLEDRIKQTIEINFKDLKALGITNPLKAVNMARNDGYLGADDMVTN